MILPLVLAEFILRAFSACHREAIVNDDVVWPF